MKHVLFLTAIIVISTSSFAQVKVSQGGGSPDASSLFEVESTTMGFLPPRMTTLQRNAIGSPAPGLRIYNIDTNCENFYNGSNWMELCGTCTPQVSVPNAGPDITNLSGSSTSLSGNSPGTENTGAWSVASGDGGSFGDNESPNSSFSGTPGIFYTLRWTHSSVCGSLFDDVVIRFLAPCTGTVSDIDDNEYSLLPIGDQCWTASNLLTTRYRNGSEIDFPEYDEYEWMINTTGAYSWYNNNPSNADTYGALYNWFAATNNAGLCPDDWHVPSDAEWQELIDFLGGDDTAAGPMKTTSGWNAPNTAASNSSGFSAVPGGFRRDDGFFNVNLQGKFWSTSEYDDLPSSHGWSRILNYDGAYVTRGADYKMYGLSVRCLRD
jgi:uncharacterized protein (TIGR02145 family)